MTPGRSIFLSVAEDSADLHGASLVHAIRNRFGNVRLAGLTGPRLRECGVQTVFDLSAHAAMLSGVLSIVGKALTALAAAESAWRKDRPSVAILIDSPELHLPMAERAKRMGIPILYYVAPQTWASRDYRNRRIAACVDRLACILPFEEAYFRRNGVSARYVGHPLFEALQRETANPAIVETLRSADDRRVVAVLPGSREHVINAVLPLQLAVIERLRVAGIPVRVAISAVDERRATRIREIVSERGDSTRRAGADSTTVVVGHNASLLTAADLVLVASGTATLHVAHYRKPMVVLYDAGRLLAIGHRLLGRRLLKTPHLSLLNILAERRIVPEFMPFVRDIDEVARVARGLLTDEAWRALLVRQIDEVVRPLESSRASEAVCDMIDELLTAGARMLQSGVGEPPATQRI